MRRYLVFGLFVVLIGLLELSAQACRSYQPAPAACGPALPAACSPAACGPAACGPAVCGPAARPLAHHPIIGLWHRHPIWHWLHPQHRGNCFRGRRPIWNWWQKHHGHHPQPGPGPSPEPSPTPPTPPVVPPTPNPVPNPPEPPVAIGAAPAGLTLYVVTDPSTCPPCRLLGPMLDKFSAAGWQVVRVSNASQLPDWIGGREKIMLMPTICVCNGQSETWRATWPFRVKPTASAIIARIQEIAKTPRPKEVAPPAAADPAGCSWGPGGCCNGQCCPASGCPANPCCPQTPACK